MSDCDEVIILLRYKFYTGIGDQNIRFGDQLVIKWSKSSILKNFKDLVYRFVFK